MVYLRMKAMDFGTEAEYVQAAYNTQAEAQAQAEHNLATQKQTPLCIVDVEGGVLVDYEE